MNTRSNPPRIGGVSVSTAVDFAIHPGAVIVFDGDSVTSGFSNGVGPDATFRWSVPFETALTAAFNNAGKTPPSYTNTGLGGRTTADCLAAIAAPIAAKPNHLFLLIGVNDWFNHGGTPIPPATTATTITSYLSQMLAAVPGCRIHVMSNLWNATENWPEGSNLNDSDVQNTNAAIKGAVAAGGGMCVYHDLRTPIFAVDEPANNHANAASGVLIQSGGGFHPTKPLGQTIISNRMLAAVPLSFT